jgi:ankyrin repeat protein
LDKELKTELLSKFPNKEKIELLLSKGANINVPIYDEGYENILDVIIPHIDDDENIDLELMKFYLEKGLNANYIDPNTGYNYLLDACRALRPDIIKLLLQYGANPNCISTETDEEALLCYVYRDINFEIMDKTLTDEMIERYKECEQLLIKYGGKCYFNLRPKKIIDYLILYDRYPTGLVTRDGNIKITNITKNKNIVKYFYRWKKYKYDKFENINIIEFEDHINKGMFLAKYLKNIFGRNIKILYYSQNIEEYKKDGHFGLLKEIEL